MVNYQRVMKMNHKYIVTLTEAERQELKEFIRKGKTQGYRIMHAQILLKLDETPENKSWTYQRIREAYGGTPHTICQIAKRFVTGGLEAALGRKEKANSCRKIDGKVEAHIVTIACSDPPEGRERCHRGLYRQRLHSFAHPVSRWLRMPSSSGTIFTSS